MAKITLIIIIIIDKLINFILIKHYNHAHQINSAVEYKRGPLCRELI